MAAMSKEKQIFVQIACYRDPEIEPTLSDLFIKAAKPERITVGLCLQLHDKEDTHIFDESKWDESVRVIKYPHNKSLGAGWARTEAGKLRHAEEYTLLIDSHTRFVEGWDEILLNMLESIASPKAVISYYPGGYTLPDKIDDGYVYSIVATRFENGVLHLSSKAIKASEAPDEPMHGIFLSTRFLFARSDFLNEVPLDPYIFFAGDDAPLSLRAFTHGWDVYHPNLEVCFHHWDRGYRKTIFDDNETWSALDITSRTRIAHILGTNPASDKSTLKEIDIYGCGNIRSVREFELRSGVFFTKHEIKAMAKSASYDFMSSLQKLEDALKPIAREFLSEKSLNKVKLLNIEYFAQQEFFDRKRNFTVQAATNTPKDLMVIENYLDPRICGSLVDFLDSRKGTRLQVVDHDKSTKDKIISKPDPSRVTEIVDCSEIAAEVISIFIDIYSNMVSPHYGVDFEWFERPQILRYYPGGKYMAHSDAENMDPKTRKWTKSLDRDYSVLLYLNEGYEGGKIKFNNFDYRLQPKAGMLVAFPSNAEYLHEAEPVISGSRYAIVSWASQLGVPKVQASPAYASIHLHSKWP